MEQMTTSGVLGEEHLSLLNEAQKEVVLTQWDKHQHLDFQVDYDVSGERDVLKGFKINKGVWNPLLSSGRYHARFLFYQSNLYSAKDVIEIGCGTGLMSVVMAKYGANKVIASDISPFAIENTKENVRKFGLEDKVRVVLSDLFQNVNERADLITWMIPFFPGNPPAGDTISASMMMPPQLFERFLQEAKNYLNEQGVVLVPSLEIGGKLTNPAVLANDFGYDVETAWAHNSINGIQRGMTYMHELRLRKLHNARII